MVVRKDIAVIADDEPGTQAALLELTLWNVSEKTLEKIIPAEIAAERRILTERRTEPAAAHRLGRTDVDNSRFELFCKIRQG